MQLVRSRRRTGEFAWLVALALVVGCSKAGRETGPAGDAVDGRPWFEDVTVESGVRFVHGVEVSGRYLFPESIGSGAAVLDFDNDGLLDLFFVHNLSPSAKATNALFRQERPGRFLDVTSGSGLETTGYGSGVAVGDVNNDGLPEV